MLVQPLQHEQPGIGAGRVAGIDEHFAAGQGLGSFFHFLALAEEGKFEHCFAKIFNFKGAFLADGDVCRTAARDKYSLVGNEKIVAPFVWVAGLLFVLCGRHERRLFNEERNKNKINTF